MGEGRYAYPVDPGFDIANQKRAEYAKSACAMKESSVLTDARSRRATLIQRRDRLNDNIEFLTQFMRVFED